MIINERLNEHNKYSTKSEWVVARKSYKGCQFFFCLDKYELIVNYLVVQEHRHQTDQPCQTDPLVVVPAEPLVLG